MRKIFYKAIFFFIFFGMVMPISNAQTTPAPLPQISSIPAQYRYPSLVCGKPLPVPSTTARDKLNTLYKDCIASNCHHKDKYSATTGETIATAVFQEPMAFIEKYEDTQSGHTIFCAFFGDDSLEYVNCNYILSTVETSYEDDTCNVGDIEEGYTPVFGPNKATFVIEQQKIPISKIPSLLGQYQARGQAFVDQSYVQKLHFAQRKRFPGLIEGPVKVQMLQNLNCESLTATRSHTLANIKLPSATVTKQETGSASETLQETESVGITVSESDTPSASATSSATLGNTESDSASATPSAFITPSESLDVSQTLTPIAIPIANWQASTGIYEDATNQPNRYMINNDIVTDTFSNLQWERAASNDTMSWQNATYYCGNRTTGGHENWRLPAVQELQSLVDYTINCRGTIPTINVTAFPDTPLSYFWSATQMARGTPDQSWYIVYGKNADSFSFSGLVYSQKFKYFRVSPNGYVRCVYGNVIPSVSNNRYNDTRLPNIVEDLVTGLMWIRQASTNMPWYNANMYCKTQTTGGFSGWRLPTVKELSTLINYNTSGFLMNKDIFAGESTWNYWSSTMVSGIPGNAWYILFNEGCVYSNGNMGHHARARCVCTGSNCRPIPIANWNALTGIYADATNQTGRYRVEDGVVTDTFSHLQWEQAHSTTTMTWSDANNYCVDRTTGNHTGWRFPTVLELQNLIDYTIDYHGPIINIAFFPGTPAATFWSSTPLADSATEAWWVSFGTQDGYNTFYYGDNSDQRYVRCVRGSYNSTIVNRYDGISLPGVVKDKLTGLWWERFSGGTSTWYNLQLYCNDRNTGNITNWRPPTIKELLTIVNYKVPPESLTMDIVFFGESKNWYWSSSVVFGAPAHAWSINFNVGQVFGPGMNGINDVRCVCSSNCLQF